MWSRLLLNLYLIFAVPTAFASGSIYRTTNNWNGQWYESEESACLTIPTKNCSGAPTVPGNAHWRTPVTTSLTCQMVHCTLGVQHVSNITTLNCVDPEEPVENYDGELALGTYRCDEPPPPPPACPDGTINQDWTIGGVVSSLCEFPLEPEPTPIECDSYGTVNGTPVCLIPKTQCQNFGTYSLDSSGIGYICVPPEVPQDEQCLSNEILVTDRYGNSWCSAITPPGYEGPPEPPDLDGDGIPDSEDSDIDGDGIPNSTDPDRDGDGVNNEDDIDPDGKEQGAGDPNDPGGSDGSVTGGGACDSEPVCKGDPVTCAIVRQTWETRCALEYDESFVDQLADSGGSPGDLFGADEDLQSELSNVYNVGGAAGSCPAPIALGLTNAAGAQLEWTPLCDFAELLRPLLVLIFGYIGFRIVMRAF